MELFIQFLKTFLVGGSICLIAQLLLNYTKITSGKILVLFLLIGVILGAFGIYDYLIDFGGAGATVPISGFGYLLADGAKKGAKESLFNAITGGIKSAGAGISSAILFGYLFALISKSRSKKN